MNLHLIFTLFGGNSDLIKPPSPFFLSLVLPGSNTPCPPPASIHAKLPALVGTPHCCIPLALLLGFLLTPMLRNKVLSLWLYFLQTQTLWVTQHSPALSFWGDDSPMHTSTSPSSGSRLHHRSHSVCSHVDLCLVSSWENRFCYEIWKFMPTGP